MKTLKILLQQLSFFSFLRLGILKLLNKQMDRFSTEVYSQCGEDMVISHLANTDDGFFIDVGCHHPVSISNTFRLYKRGWTGINIDANPDLINKFQKVRPKDVSLCVPVSDKKQEYTFYEFESDAMSTLDEEQAKEFQKFAKVVNTRQVESQTLTEILDTQKIDKPIDLLNIDVEGHDYNVLKSLDFKKYRPRIIIIEIHGFDIENPTESAIFNLLKEEGYKWTAYAINNAYFVDANTLN